MNTPDNNRKITTSPTPKTDHSRFTFWKKIGAFSMVLAIAGFAVAVYFGKMYYQTEDGLNELIIEHTQMAEELQFNNIRLSELEFAFSISADPNYQKIGLIGLQIQPTASLSVWWNEQSEATFLMVNNLTPLPDDKDYQLWATIDEQFVDMGILADRDQGSFLKMKDTPKASAFSITIEPKGGRPDPTIDQMCASGIVG